MNVAALSFKYILIWMITLNVSRYANKWCNIDAKAFISNGFVMIYVQSDLRSMKSSIKGEINIWNASENNVVMEIHGEFCKQREIIAVRSNFAEKNAAKCKSQSSYVLSAYTRKIFFYWRWNPPINTASSLPSAGRSNIFITSSARRKVTVIHFIRFLGLLFQHFFHHQILTKAINTYWIRSRNISFS